MEILHSFINWYVGHINYYTVCFLMVIESSFIPFPSEAVIPIAAYKAAQGQLNIYLVILSGTIGALIGALINYYLALWLGRPIVHKLAGTTIGKMLLLSPEKIEHAERYFVKHGKSSTLVGRLVPAVRQLISIPAGLAKMNLKDFILFTTIGAGLWNIILAVIGYFLYETREQVLPYLGYILLALGVGFIGYLILSEKKKAKKRLEKKN